MIRHFHIKSAAWGGVLFVIVSASTWQLYKFSSMESKIPYCYIKINNPVLEEEIVQYRDYIDKYKKWMDSVYVEVSMRTISDSVTRYVLSPVTDCYDILYMGPFFICNVRGNDTFFVPTAGFSFGKRERTLFRISDANYWLLTKKYFPKRYAEKITKGYLSNSMNLHPEICFLTFLNDSLIDKRYQRGLFLDSIEFNIHKYE